MTGEKEKTLLEVNAILNPEDISNSERKKTDFRKYSKNCNIIDGDLTYWGKKVIFGNDTTRPLYFIEIKYSFTMFELQKELAVKCFSITIPHFFLFTRKFKEYLLPKGVTIYQEKRLQGVLIIWEPDWESAFSWKWVMGNIFTGSIYLRLHRHK